MSALTYKVVADQLEISASTLKRWIGLLEQEGYLFQMSGSVRKLQPDDVKVLEKLKNWSTKPNTTLEQAVTKTKKWVDNKTSKTSPPVSDPTVIGVVEDAPELDMPEEEGPLFVLPTPGMKASSHSDSDAPVLNVSALHEYVRELDHVMVHLVPGMFWKGKEIQRDLLGKWEPIRQLVLGEDSPDDFVSAEPARIRGL